MGQIVTFNNMAHSAAKYDMAYRLPWNSFRSLNFDISSVSYPRFSRLSVLTQGHKPSVSQSGGTHHEHTRGPDCFTTSDVTN